MFLPGQPISSAVPAELQALRATGATVARSDSFWQTAEPTPPVNGIHSYDWTFDDAMVAALAQAGLRWEPIIDYATLWAGIAFGGANPGVSPSHYGDYAAYAGALAARYGPAGTFWAQRPDLAPQPVTVFEIWNEPDLSLFWGPAPHLADYATMFGEAQAAIKAVQPESKVIIGGLKSPVRSMGVIFAADPGLLGKVDGVAIHPYASSTDGTLQIVTAALNTDAATFNVPLYVNEYGWGTVGTWQYASEADRDIMIGQVTQQLSQIPQVADIDLFGWSGPTGFGAYGTPAQAAFAGAIAAAQSRTAAAPAPASTNGQPAPVGAGSGGSIPTTRSSGSAPPTLPVGGSAPPTGRVTGLKVRGLTADVGISCRGVPGVRCRIVLILSAADQLVHRKARTLSRLRSAIPALAEVGRAAANLATGRSATVRVPLNRAGTRLVATHHRLKVKVTITMTLHNTRRVLRISTITFTRARFGRTNPRRPARRHRVHHH